MDYPMKNRLKEKMRLGRPTLGTWVSIGHPDVAEILSKAGYDWLLFDMEHAPLSAETVHRLMQACSGPAEPLVRVPPGDRFAIQQSLDGGAHGVIVPLVNSRGDAERAVAACFYAPKGDRNMGPRRATDYSLRWDEYLEHANDSIFLGIQIETIEAVANIEEILSVQGIDAALIGPGDLAASMGCMKNRQDARYLKSIASIFHACSRHRIIPGIAYASDAPAANKFLEQGFKMIGLGEDDIFLAKSAQAALQGILPRFQELRAGKGQGD